MMNIAVVEACYPSLVAFWYRRTLFLLYTLKSFVNVVSIVIFLIQEYIALTRLWLILWLRIWFNTAIFWHPLLD